MMILIPSPRSQSDAMNDYSAFQCIMLFTLEQTFMHWACIALYSDVMYHVLCVTVNLVYQ